MCHLSNIKGHNTYYNAISPGLKNIIIIFAIKQARKIFHSIYRLTKVKYKLHNLRHNFILFAFRKILQFTIGQLHILCFLDMLKKFWLLIRKTLTEIHVVISCIIKELYSPHMYLEYNHSFIILRYLNIKYILKIRIILIYLNPYGFRANDPLTWSWRYSSWDFKWIKSIAYFEKSTS